MPYIYKITNNINNNVYIGKTVYSINKRWGQHLRDCRKESENFRPLYCAMLKYGEENFSIKEVEECESELLEEREKYWIEYYGSFKNGYNATLGGDGKQYADYDLILKLYNSGMKIKDISKVSGYCYETCKTALNNKGVTSEQRSERSMEIIRKPVLKIDTNTGEILNAYPSILEAYRSLNRPQSGHIASVCKGKRKTAYGYKWKYL